MKPRSNGAEALEKWNDLTHFCATQPDIDVFFHMFHSHIRSVIVLFHHLIIFECPRTSASLRKRIPPDISMVDSPSFSKSHRKNLEPFEQALPSTFVREARSRKITKESCKQLSCMQIARHQNQISSFPFHHIMESRAAIKKQVKTNVSIPEILTALSNAFFNTARLGDNFVHNRQNKNPIITLIVKK